MTAVEITPKFIQKNIFNKNIRSRWFTPPNIVSLVEKVFQKPIDLDPCSEAEANQYIKASSFFSENGLEKSWKADTIFCNPPSPKEKWLYKMIEEYKAGNFNQGIFLVFSIRVETKWAGEIYGYYPIAHLKNRIKFIPPDGIYASKNNNQPVHGNGLVYFGNNQNHFYNTVEPFARSIIPDYIIKGCLYD